MRWVEAYRLCGVGVPKYGYIPMDFANKLPIVATVPYIVHFVDSKLRNVGGFLLYGSIVNNELFTGYNGLYAFASRSRDTFPWPHYSALVLQSFD